MELLDRYLQAVSKHLPLKRQDDIIAELRANLEAQLEEKEAELGRPLDPIEAQDWLRQVGSPLQMASLYLPQQYLIGPAIFPMYWYVLKLALMWGFLIYAIASTVAIIFQAPAEASVVEAIARTPGMLMSVAFCVTLLFAALEFGTSHYPEKCPQIPGLSSKWNPADLPAVESRSPHGRKPRSFVYAFAEVVVDVLILCWLLLVPQFPFVMFGPGARYLQASPYQLAPIWMTAFWWLVAMNCVQLAWRFVDLWRGAWQYPNVVRSLVVRAISLVPLGLLLSLNDRTYVLLKPSELDQAGYGASLGGANILIHTVILLITTVVGLKMAWEIGQALWDAWRRREKALS